MAGPGYIQHSIRSGAVMSRAKSRGVSQALARELGENLQENRERNLSVDWVALRKENQKRANSNNRIK